MIANQATSLRILGDLLEAHTGQQLVAGRQWRVETVLKPVARSLGLANVEALAAKVFREKEPALQSRVVEALLNNETSFYRDPTVLELLNTAGFDRMRANRAGKKILRIWSAGCSTGQEAFSVAIMLAEADERWKGWKVEISGTDVSDAAIARAKAGRYTQFEIQRGLPVRTMLRWFDQQGENWQIDSRLRRMVRFARHSLLDPPPGEYDIILCRNVLMYFAPPVRRTVFERLRQALAPDGMLMLGAGETVIGQTTSFAVHPDFRGLYGVTQPEKRVG